MSVAEVNRGYFLEIAGVPESDVVASYFWSPLMNLRPFRDVVICRQVLGSKDIEALRSQLDHRDFKSSEPVVGVEPVSKLDNLVRDINQRRKVPADNIVHVSIESGTEAHVDTIHKRRTEQSKIADYYGKSTSVVLSVGISGTAVFGLSPKLPSWHEVELYGDIFTADGNFPEIADMRTSVTQHVGDIVVIRPGIVHATRAYGDRRALLINQSRIVD